MERLDAAGTKGLAVVAGLLRTLNEDGIPYCHWKSNEHLRESLLGLTDLDVLVDRRSYRELSSVLDRLGFKRFDSIPGKAYPGVEDFLASDPGTGRLIHLHLHNRLTMGEKHLKGYRLPWESEILSTRKWDEESGAFIADPHIEILLLLVRSALKLRFRDRLFALGGRRIVDEDTSREFRWLTQRVDAAEVVALAQRLLGEASTGVVDDLLSTGPSFAKLLTLRRRARSMLGLARTYRPVMANCQRWAREVLWAWGVAGQLLFRRTNPIRRTNPRGGILIVILGCDGSGKSTMLREVVAWLSKKIDVAPIYFGSGDGPSSLLRWPFKLAVSFVSQTSLYRSYRQRRASARAPGPRTQPHQAPWFEEAFRVVYALVLSREKRARLQTASRARNLGMVVVCDRYPQNQVMGFNDGPLLSHLLAHRFALVRALARWESLPYGMSEASPPDLVVKLHVTPAMALRRKSDMDMAEVLRRVQAVKELSYAPSAHVADIDADQPLDVVLNQVKRAIWQEL